MNTTSGLHKSGSYTSIKVLSKSSNSRKVIEFLKKIKANKIKAFFKQNLIKTYYTFDRRMKYAEYVSNFIASLSKEACIEPRQISAKIDGVDKIVFDGYTIHDVIFLEKLIGRPSHYGVVYKTFIKNMLGGSPIATKLMQNTRENRSEIKINELISGKILDTTSGFASRHYLLLYKVFTCTHKNKLVEDDRDSHRLGKITKGKYLITLNEMAHGDLRSLLEIRSIAENYDVIINIALQCLLGIASFHKLGYTHNDCHWANFLYHKIDDKNMYYHYAINGTDYYLESCGYSIMICDFGLATHALSIESSIDDYTKILQAFMNKNRGGWSIFDDLPCDEISSFVEGLYYHLTNKTMVYQNETEIVDDIIHAFRNFILDYTELPKSSKIANKVAFVI
jgi:serine/threonine protein kinase